MSDQEGAPRPRDALRPDAADTESTATATATDEAVNAETYIPEPGEQPSDLVPVENWVYWPPVDETEYMDRKPIYTVEAPGEAESQSEDKGEAESKEQAGGTTTET